MPPFWLDNRTFLTSHPQHYRLILVGQLCCLHRLT
ncbi:hypothetical protein NC653_000431 [Populus alba x Populus x berolinensis]|uniref:Uncharacterized protein n=1 Tax=Populus alba x Populus x berolinensis TaxID=444605 RepID=A0AAD6RJ98_9ROSI|nr:hypothetical protein NC653_000431 [Populus alba x Populus x berolinensis]